MESALLTIPLHVKRGSLARCCFVSRATLRETPIIPTQPRPLYRWGIYFPFLTLYHNESLRVIYKISVRRLGIHKLNYMSKNTWQLHDHIVLLKSDFRYNSSQLQVTGRDKNMELGNRLCRSNDIDVRFDRETRELY